MAINKEAYLQIRQELGKENITLVAVSKTKPVEDIMALYELGQRDFGENYVQELVHKQGLLPHDIRWHFIGHLQTNKARYIVPFVHLVHGVDSLKLLKEVNKQAQKTDRVVACLLQVYIAREETKFGLNEKELDEAIQESTTFRNLEIKGLMGMASFSDDTTKQAAEFRRLKQIFDQQKIKLPLSILSMGMSADYKIAVREGGNMVRIGSLLFGARG